MRKALFVGRFQPFHNGHLKVIRDILKANDRIAIVIGGPAKPDEKNPFSFGEREGMIKAALKAEGINRYEIYKVPDVNDDEKWSSKIKSLGQFEVAYSRNPWTIRCLKKAGIPVRQHKFYERYENCGREIRNRIADGKQWRKLVPAKVYAYIMEIKGEDRIRKNMHQRAA